jgi:hypothetical protein
VVADVASIEAGESLLDAGGGEQFDARTYSRCRVQLKVARKLAIVVGLAWLVWTSLAGGVQI